MAKNDETSKNGTDMIKRIADKAQAFQDRLKPILDQMNKVMEEMNAMSLDNANSIGALGTKSALAKEASRVGDEQDRKSVV